MFYNIINQYSDLLHNYREINNGNHGENYYNVTD